MVWTLADAAVVETVCLGAEKIWVRRQDFARNIAKNAAQKPHQWPRSSSTIPLHPHSERWHQLVDEHQVTVKMTKTTILKLNMKTVSNSKPRSVPRNRFKDSISNIHTPEMASSVKTTTPTRTLIIPGLKLGFKAMSIPMP